MELHRKMYKIENSPDRWAGKRPGLDQNTRAIVTGSFFAYLQMRADSDSDIYV